MNNHWSKQKKKNLYNKIVLSELFNSELKFISKSKIRIRKTDMCIGHKQSTINISKYNKIEYALTFCGINGPILDECFVILLCFILTGVK